MKHIQEKHLRQLLIRQHDQSDCGVACLLSLIQYYGGNESLEKLRKLSGTNIQGTTLLGMYQAAIAIGFTAEGCSANVEILKTHPFPVILHVVIHDTLQHYVVCFGTRKEKSGHYIFTIGDPAKGIIYMSEEDLNGIWKSKSCLTLEPNENFISVKDAAAAKRKWITNLLREDYPLLATAIVLGVAMAVLGLTMAIFSQKLIDEILPQKNTEKLYVGAALVLAILLVKQGLAALRQYFMLRQSKDFNSRIIDFFYQHLLYLPKTFFDTRKVGELTARLNDTGRIQRIISQLVGNSVIELLVVLASILFLLSYSMHVGIATIVIIPLLYFILDRSNNATVRAQKTAMENYAATEANYISTLQGIEILRGQNKQKLFAALNNTFYNKYQDAVFNLGKIQIRLSVIANCFSTVFLLGTLLYGSYLVLQNLLSIGELIAILSICGSLLSSTVNLALLSIPINEAKIAFDRMFEFTNAQPEFVPGQSKSIPALINMEVRKLQFRFPGRRLLLNDISFNVSKGEIIAIMGENGCGKSTLIQILQRNYNADAGEILVNNRTLEAFPLSDWRNVCAVVPQHIHIFNTTVLENISFEDATNNPQKVVGFLDSMGFASFMNTLPQSVLTLVGEEGINLSGGQKQLVAIARALYTNPQLLILDEATSAMDRESEQFVLDLLEKMRPKMAIILVSHRLHVIKNVSDRIYILERGTVVATGDHDNLLKSKNLYSMYWKDLVKTTSNNILY